MKIFDCINPPSRLGGSSLPREIHRPDELATLVRSGDGSEQCQRLEALIMSSVAEGTWLDEYAENGSDKFNAELRKFDPRGNVLPKDVHSLLIDLYSQSEWHGAAYRAVHVTPEAGDILAQVGRHVTDLGIQSASVNIESVEGWMQFSSTNSNLVETVLVFDSSVPKRNIATGFLPDHVAVCPAERLVVRDSGMLEGRLNVLLSAGRNNHEDVYSIYDGQLINNFFDHVALQRSLRQ